MTSHLPRILTPCLLAAVLLAAPTARAQTPDPRQKEERTSFQTGAPWDAGLQLPADVAMVYGIGKDMPDRVRQWKERGYIVHLMTGVSWGQYQDYLYGRFDGKNHVDEAQMDRNGKVISHGGDVYYMCPGPTYGTYLAQNVLRAIDAGVEAIHLEEPEFWARAGYGEGFKRAWREHYKEEWLPPHESADAQYRASKLKYVLYRDALQQIFDAVKKRNAETGKHVKCYVPTHSLVNYALWNIVSPESSLLTVGADGFIAQVWTGTARSQNVYEGKAAERTFQTAFFEYGSMTAATRGSNGRLWFLHDPIEDDPNHAWDDYKSNWECTVIGSLFWPETTRYEVAPWPERIFHGKYPAPGTPPAPRLFGRRRRDDPNRIPIPADYATELMTVMNALNDMDQPDLAWESGTRGIGLVVSDALMFQREGFKPSDPHLGNFFGLALPCIQRGIPAEPVQLENLRTTADLGRYKVLMMTYEGMKPMTDAADKVLAEWVKAGGVLLFVDDDKDPYNGIRSWWNAPGGPGYATPRQALFEALGVGRDAKPGSHPVGSGTLIWAEASPAGFSHQREGATEVRKLIEQACGAAKLAYHETNHLVLRRGPYVVAAGLDSAPGESPYILGGRFVDLFDAGLKVIQTVKLDPTRRSLLLDLDRVPAKGPRVLAAACRVTDEAPKGEGLSFFARGPKEITASVRVALPHAPKAVAVAGKPLDAGSQTWDEASKTLLLRFPNSADAVQVTIE
ncbi:hypothetical protein [Paludisphaera mucosa]|uniref:Beta-galactosidase trimerisation domain-containing protein n=1 Tax=Paludisphaera mucosa TaxID=3030827 RepID=A0ABT6FHH4_9BACT|nr:hypothetical protein [Paludisphaera mucosa]MDG3007038.1 hypothetical protein [Paludisphaera mucosa]